MLSRKGVSSEYIMDVDSELWNILLNHKSFSKYLLSGSNTI